jgi:hypothetical protein
VRSASTICATGGLPRGDTVAAMATPAKLPSDVDGLYLLVEPLFVALNEKGVDYPALRAKFPPATRTSTRVRSPRVEDALVIRGSAVADKGIALDEGAALFVLGDLHVTGGLYSPPFGYSLLFVGGTLHVDRLHTSGDVLAFGGIHANLFWGSANDHSTYAPFLDAETYLATDDRGDVVCKLSATTKIVGFDVNAKLRKRFPELDAEDGDSIRAFVGLAAPKPRKAARSTAAENEAIRTEILAAWAIGERKSKVAALRAVYAKIKKRKLSDCGELLVEMIATKRVVAPDNWSIQDELELLAALGRADLLAALPEKYGEGYEGWIPGLLEKARKARGG